MTDDCRLRYCEPGWWLMTVAAAGLVMTADCRSFRAHTVHWFSRIRDRRRRESPLREWGGRLLGTINTPPIVTGNQVIYTRCTAVSWLRISHVVDNVHPKIISIRDRERVHPRRIRREPSGSHLPRSIQHINPRRTSEVRKRFQSTHRRLPYPFLNLDR